VIMTIPDDTPDRIHVEVACWTTHRAISIIVCLICKLQTFRCQPSGKQQSSHHWPVCMDRRSLPSSRLQESHPSSLVNNSYHSAVNVLQMVGQGAAAHNNHTFVQLDHVAQHQPPFNPPHMCWHHCATAYVQQQEVFTHMLPNQNAVCTSGNLSLSISSCCIHNITSTGTPR